ncbi:N-acetylmuramoyl-L-alanine amidase [Aquimarina sp. W85]|uniref:N-acetylmuramoyl-L-alanine amidase n=1 Tax=Aquimarina rhodophyticola TaxID=3342246 RepID=UPI00366A70B1
MKKNILPMVIGCFLIMFTTFAQDKINNFKGEGSSNLTIDLSQEEGVLIKNKMTVNANGIVVKKATQENAELILKPVQISIKKPKPFISAYTVWTGKYLEYSKSILSYRTSNNGKTWSDWNTAMFDGHQEQTSKRITSKPIFLDKKTKQIQYRIKFTDATDDVQVTNVKIFNYSPGETPKHIQKNIRNTNKNALRTTCSKPAVVSRDDWGAIYRNAGSTSTVSHLIIHHEFGSNSSNDWAARVRSIQNYHINGNGWADIGYNFLVDPNGVIYEGRAGGDNAIGAHFCGKNSNTMGVCMLGDYSSVTPSNATQNALKDLLAWKATKETIDPLGASYHYSVNSSLTHIAGHRDAGCTVCPGDGGYESIANVRTGVNLLMSSGCNGDTTPPTTTISAIGGTWQTGDFTVNYLDNDNIEVTRKYYQVQEKYGTSYLANRRIGFLNENFNQDFGVYDIGAGNWTVSSGNLKQSNILSDNTLWSSFLVQDSGLPYLYEFDAKIVSTTGPRKFGLHIMASDPLLTQRGNSYLLWFSGEDNKIRIYETVNNILYSRAIADVSLDKNWATYRVTYSPAYGVIQIWKNNQLLLNWVDSSPIVTGAAISLRTNQTAMEFDNLRVYKYRTSGNTLITVGNLDATNDLRTANGKVRSMVRDAVGNWSLPADLDITIASALSKNSTRNDQNKITVYPNEIIDNASLTWVQPEHGVVTISIYDVFGNIVSKMPSSYSVKGQSSLDISSATNQLTPGIYVLKLITGSHTETIKLLKR